MANNQLKEEIILQTGQFDKNINNVIRKVEELRNKGNKVGSGFNTSMGKMIERATGFNGSLGSLVGVVGKFSGALGVAMGAGEAFNKTLNSSQTLTDAFGATQQSVTTIVDSFFQSLANGDFSPFLNGMDNMVSKAKEAYVAMDELWNMAQSFSVQNARLNNQFQQNLNEIRAKKDSKDPNDKKRVAELTQQNKDIIKKQAEGGVKLYNQTIKGLQSEIAAGTGMNSKITEGAIYRIVENDINNLKDGRAKYEKEYSEYKKLEAKLQKKYQNKQVGGGLINKVANTLNPTANYGTGYQKELNQLQTKYGEAIAANYLLQRKSDEELGEFNNKLKQGISYQGVAIANQSKILRYVKETNQTTKSGKGGKGGGKNTVNYAEGSVGYWETLISDLQKQIKLQVDSSAIVELKKQIKEAKSELDQLMNPIKIEPIDLSTLGTPQLFNNGLPDAKDLDLHVKTLPEMYKESLDRVRNVFDAYDMGLIGEDKAKELIDGINKNLVSFGLKPIEVHFETDADKLFGNIEDKASSILMGFEGIDGVVDNITSLSEAIYNGANAWETFIGVLETSMSIIQAVSDVIKTVNTLTELFGTTQLVAAEQTAAAAATEVAASTTVTAAKSGEAIAGATASGSKLPFPFNLAAIAAGIAAVVGALSMIGAFANGGIVGGNSYAGDGLIARVNSGEMILNGSQQKNLFNLLDKGNTSGVANGGNVHFVIRGQDLHGVLNNYDNKMKKVR